MMARSHDWVTIVLLLVAGILGGYAAYVRFGPGQGARGDEPASAQYGRVGAERFRRAAETGDRIGPENAPITVVVFSNYLCEYCRRFEPTLTQLHHRYPDEVAIVWKHYAPLLTRRASTVDLAADCAADQGDFAPFNHALFTDTLVARVPDRWLRIGQRIGIDTATMAGCIRSRRHAADVMHDTEEGQALGVTGTPTSFINGVRIVGQVPFDILDSVVSSQLRSGRPSTK